MDATLCRAMFHCFDTPLGWMATVWNDDVLSRLTMGHASPQAAVRALEMEALETTNSSPEAVSEVQAAVHGRLAAVASGRADDLRDVAIDLSHLTDFQRSVVQNCRRIPRGQTKSYGELAALAGSPRAARAVGNVMAANRYPLIVPCHRVLASGGAIGGFSAPRGVTLKERLLALEGICLQG